LAYLHTNGLVHRDVKLENVIVTNAFWSDPSAPGTVRLVDFGISAAIGNPQKLTDVGRMIGTVPYMAPEIIDPRYWPATPTAAAPTIDVFAFGVLGWGLLRGSHPTELPMNASSVDYAVRYRAFDTHGAPWSGAAHASRQSSRDRWDAALEQCVAPRAAHRPADGWAILRAVDGDEGPAARSPQAPGAIYPSTAPATVTAPATTAHPYPGLPSAPATEPSGPPAPEALTTPSQAAASRPPSTARPGPRPRPLAEAPRTSSPLVREVAPGAGHRPGPAPTTTRPDRFPVVAVVVLAAIGGAMATLFGIDWYLTRAPERSPPPPRRDPAQLAPPATTTPIPPPPPTRKLPATAPPSAPTACSCEKKLKCGTLWSEGTTGACTEPIPPGEYLLRLSFVGLTPRGGGHDLVSVFEAEPDAVVCLRVAGAPPEEEVCVRGPTTGDGCLMTNRLRLPLTQFLRPGPGIDVVVRSNGQTLAQGHVDPYDASTKQQRLCTGFVATTRGWAQDPGWGWNIAKIGLFLDPL
jgi:eukaryotic-like serine/threonine-protein kinase